jgi:hypothetical protein
MIAQTSNLIFDMLCPARTAALRNSALAIRYGVTTLIVLVCFALLFASPRLSLRGQDRSSTTNSNVPSTFAEDAGAALVFSRRGGHWTQDEQLVGAGAVGKSAPSVALSADGSIVMVGGSNDNGGVGAAWMFTRRGANWTQDKNLVGTGAVGKSAPSVASAEDSIVIVGRSNDSGSIGEASVFTRSDGDSDYREPYRP